MIPNSKPQAKREVVLKPLTKVFKKLHPELELPDVFIGCIRGYYLRTMGNPDKNDRGEYDDAAVLFSPNVYATFIGNTDPSRYRKFIAMLEAPQVIWYVPGKHPAMAGPTQHDAFRQDSPVIVLRDQHVKPAGFVDPQWGVSLGGGRWTDKGWKGGKFWTNLHRGGRGTTSSLGCLTLPPGQFEAMRTLAVTEMKRAGQKRIPVVLFDGPIN